MAAAIKDKFGAKSKLVPGAGGIFDVEVDGKMVFSKFETSRFPEEPEVLEAIEKL